MIEVTLRGGPGEDGPWIVIYANTIDEAVRLINTAVRLINTTPQEVSNELRRVQQ